MRIKIRIVIAAMFIVLPLSCSLADETIARAFVKASQVDASKVPMEQWESEYTVTAMIRVKGKKSDAILKPIGRKSSIYENVKVATLVPDRPLAKFRPLVQYPFELVKLGVPGGVVVSFVVTGVGEVCDIRILEASDKRFGEAVKSMVSKWTYKGVAHGRSDRFLCILPIRFRVISE